MAQESFEPSYVLAQKRYLSFLIKRLGLLRSNYAVKSDFERNEIEIEEFETIETLNRRYHHVVSLEKKIAEKVLGEIKNHIDA